MSKPTIAAGTNSLSTTNEKRTTPAYRDFLKRERFQPEHKATKHHIEVGMNSLHRMPATYIPVNRGSQNAPPQRTPPGSGEVLERDRGSKSPVSFQPPPRGINKIYKCDAVFSIGETNTNPISQTQFPYKSHDISQT